MSNLRFKIGFNRTLQFPSDLEPLAICDLNRAIRDIQGFNQLNRLQQVLPNLEMLIHEGLKQPEGGENNASLPLSTIDDLFGSYIDCPTTI